MREINKIIFIIHPKSERSLALQPYPYILPSGDEYINDVKRREILKKEAEDEKTAICILQRGRSFKYRAEKLVKFCEKYFGDRCFDSPYDDSIETRLLLLEDLERTIKYRGNYEEWIPYEIWSSNNARRWAEGLKKEMKRRGYFFDPGRVEAECWGHIWSGCSIKYGMFMAKYLGLSNPMKRNVEIPLKNTWPIKVKKFVGSYTLDHYVQLFIFIDDFCQPVAEYIDGLRGVWEHPHIAIVPIDSKNVDLFTIPPNEFLRVRESKSIDDRIIADVGDGCHPAFTIIVGKNITLSEFVSAVKKAKIIDRIDRPKGYINSTYHVYSYYEIEND